MTDAYGRGDGFFADPHVAAPFTVNSSRGVPEGEVESADPSDSKGVEHFDLRAIVKADRHRISSRRHKPHRHTQLDMAETIEERDTFVMDLDDGRFRNIVDHQFAIDPTNPSYKPTRNMSTLLQRQRIRRTDGARRK